MNVIIVDDDKAMLLAIKKILKKMHDIDTIDTFNNIKEGIDFFNNNKADIAFLDISIKNGNGLDLARSILEKSPDTDIVFITSYREYAVEAFDMSALDYIVKPVSIERVERSVKKALEKRLLAVEKSFLKEEEISVSFFGGIDVSSKKSGAVKWISAKSMELFAYLILEEGHSVPKNVIIEEIFYEMPLKNAENYLKTSIYQIRKALESHCSKSVLISNNGSYKIDLSVFNVDFIDFEKRISKLEEINSLNIKEALYIEKLFLGELLGDKEYYWSSLRKEKYLNLYISLGKRIGEYFLSNGEIDKASYILKRMLRFNQTNEEANSLFMEIFAVQNDKKSLTEHYERYTKVLKNELDISPEVTIANLYKRLLNSF